MLLNVKGECGVCRNSEGQAGSSPAQCGGRSHMEALPCFLFSGSGSLALTALISFLKDIGGGD